MAENVAHNELHRIVATAIIYNDEGKYLITKRAPGKKVFPGKWHVPGGGLEATDYVNTPADSEGQWYGVIESVVRREVLEETTLEIEKPEYLLDLTFVRPDGIPVVVLSYFAKRKSGEVQLNEEDDTEYAWVTFEEAKEYDLIHGILDELRQVDEILKTRK